MGRIDKFEQNMALNGGMDLWQRGIAFVGANDYTADRFRFVRDIGVTDINRSIDVPSIAESGYASQFSMFLNVTTLEAAPAAAEIHRMNYRMEGLDVAEIIGQSLFISFWVKTNKTGIYSFALNNSNSGRSFVTEYTVNSSQVWQRIRKKIPIEISAWNLDNTLSLEAQFTFAAGPDRKTSTLNQWFTQSSSEVASTNQVNFLDATNNEFRLTQVQMITVENGFRESEVVIPFRRVGRNFAHELSMAQRYFETGNASLKNDFSNDGGATFGSSAYYATHKRVGAAVGITVQTAVGLTAGPIETSPFGAPFNGFHFVGTATASGVPASHTMIFIWDADSEL